MLLSELLKDKKDSLYLLTKDAGNFKEEEHPRGQPANAGQFAKGAGSAKKAEPQEGEEARKGGGKFLGTMQEMIRNKESDEAIKKAFTQMFKEKGVTDPAFIAKRIEFYKKLTKKFPGGEPPKKTEPVVEPKKTEEPKPTATKTGKKFDAKKFREKYQSDLKSYDKEAKPYKDQMAEINTEMINIRMKLVDTNNSAGVGVWKQLESNERYQKLKFDYHDAKDELDHIRFQQRHLFREMMFQPTTNQKIPVAEITGGSGPASERKEAKKWAEDTLSDLFAHIDSSALDRTGWHNSETRRVSINYYPGTMGRACFNYGRSDGGEITLHKKGKDDLIHEFGHWIEWNNAAAKRAVVRFKARRTGEEKARPLNSIKNSSCYDDHEIAKPDKFFNAYVGKIYPNGSTEILSMGLEEIMARPAEFAKKDPEHFELICEIMQGVYPGEDKKLEAVPDYEEI
jgi:hypothetical protein